MMTLPSIITPVKIDQQDGKPIRRCRTEDQDDREVTLPLLMMEQIEGHPSALRMFQQTLDGLARGWFERLPANSIDEWLDLREAFATKYSVIKACFKEPHEITKIVRRANESLTTFKERWTVETGFIMGVPEVMKISSFMDSLKCPELAKHFSDKAPVYVNDMIRRLNEFVRFEKAFSQTELLKGKMGKQHRKSYFFPARKDDRLFRNNYMGDPRRSTKEKKRKAREVTEEWMNSPITFPPVLTEDVFDEPLIIEAEVEGYLVRRIYVDRGASVDVMFEHCFENLSPTIKGRLKETQTDLVGFAWEAMKPLGKIELEVCFGSKGLCKRTTMKFTVIRDPSPYNIILGRTGLRTLSGIPSTIHSMMKFPTPRGIATLVIRSVIISECRQLEKKQVIEEEEKKKEVETRVINVT
uniref:Reverse transcriptase domain-containing protein n=1 Tax=Tanacetum cinerariifolium TaxID=118510 RepID=A0A6L2JWF3_TANCI|nr:reverse transcriptase domain-containing protein [Tanacetum cinerariifolium]